MNSGSKDFSHWQANARGVDLNHNYDAGFAEYKQIERQSGITEGAPTRYSGESPESEPEVAAICSLIRTLPFSFLMTLHSQGEEIYYKYSGNPEEQTKNFTAVKALASMTGYALSTPQGAASYGGLSDWAGGKMGVPSVTLECGKGENPLPIEECMKIYGGVRRALFCAPMMF